MWTTEKIQGLEQGLETCQKFIHVTMCILSFHKSVHAFLDGVRSVVMTCSLPFCRLTDCMRFLRCSELSRVALLSCPAFTHEREEYYRP